MTLESLLTLYGPLASTSAQTLDSDASTNASLLDPLTRSLLYELTTRRDRIAEARWQLAFWNSPRGREIEAKYYSQPDPAESATAKGKARVAHVDQERQEEELDRRIAECRTRLESVLDAQGVKKAILTA